MSGFNTPSPEKVAAQEKIRQDIDRFLASGGEIGHVPIQKRYSSEADEVDEKFIEEQRRRGAKAHRAKQGSARK